MSFIIHKVVTSKDKQDFLEVARVIYRDDPIWICPMDKQLHAIFEPATNNYFAHGFAERWVLKSPEATLIGRIAAFVDTDKQINSEIKAETKVTFESKSADHIAESSHMHIINQQLLRLLLTKLGYAPDSTNKYKLINALTYVNPPIHFKIQKPKYVP